MAIRRRVVAVIRAAGLSGQASGAAGHRVTVFHAAGCHLCERALEVVAEVCGGEFDAVDIGGDPELEARYRELLPVVEVDGERAFTYFVDAAGLRRRLAAPR